MVYASMDSTMSRPSSGIASPPRHAGHIRSRTQSISSDRPSTVGHGLMSPPLTVSPEAAFIAGSAASQIVTNDHDGHADTWYDQHGIEPSGETVLVSPSALQLVNNFLDQLLFNFLQLSRSTSLNTLRPAVSEVLKPKLAKDAINQADEELREYLGGNDDDELLNGVGADAADWDMELVWKRTRLRCMVYSSLGDMEEEDEDYYMEQEHLDGGSEDWLAEVVSPAVAIFLTSILEYMGEQALIVAGQAAYHRMRSRYEKELKDGSKSPGDVADRIVVEELDMERVALDRTLGRLWRAWKKRIRSPGIDQAGSSARSVSRGNAAAAAAQWAERSRVTAENLKRHNNLARQSAEVDEDQLDTPILPKANPAVPTSTVPEVPSDEEEPTEEYLKAAAIVLPMGERDVDEIEVPGLVYYSDEEDEEDEDDEDGLFVSQRPKSLMVIPTASIKVDLPTPSTSQPTTPLMQGRKRSNSLPTPAASPYRSPVLDEAELVAADDGEVTPTEDVETPTTATMSSDDLPAPLKMQPKYRAAKGPIADIITSASKSKRSTMIASPRSDGDEYDEDEDDEIPDDFEILTSSRISVSGRSGSPTASESGRNLATAAAGVTAAAAAAAVTASGLGRSSSVRSARLIEVSNPRSPVTRSRTSSVEAAELPASPVLSSHFQQPPRSVPSHVANVAIVEDKAAFMEVTSAPRSQQATARRRNTAESIEDAVAKRPLAKVESPPPSATVLSPVTSEPASVSSPRRFEDLQNQISNINPIFGSVGRHKDNGGSANLDLGPAGTRVTILGSSGSDDVPPQVPDKSPVHSRHQRVPTPPRVNGSSLPGSPTTIGIPSVDHYQENAGGRVVSGGSVRSGDNFGSAVAAQRPIHTSGSSGSAQSATKIKPIRTSEEGRDGQVVARTFEELIQSDQTMKYTLTPESMRDIASSRSINNGSPVLTQKRKSEDTRQSTIEQRPASAVARNSDLKRTASVTRATGLNSHPVDLKPAVVTNVTVTSTTTTTTMAPAVQPFQQFQQQQQPPQLQQLQQQQQQPQQQQQQQQPQPQVRLSGPVPRAPANMPSRVRQSAPQAREARVPRESVLDFADFIRTTGPPGDVSGSGAGSRVSTVRNVGGPVPVSSSSKAAAMMGGGATGMAAAADRRVSSMSKARLQAREAAVSSAEDNSDLIDFIRRGPPSARENNPRIPRSVAPFRTTMDSDQMAGAVGGRAVDANLPNFGGVVGAAADRSNSAAGYNVARHSQASTNVTELSMPSVHSSINSQSALLKNSNKPLPSTMSNNAMGANDFDDGDMMPKRKTRRVRDPYAIDFSDEDDEDEGQLTDRPGPARQQAPPRQEESLMDFLRSVPPPPEARSPTLPFDIPQTRAPKKKASAPSLMSRFSGRGSSSNTASSAANSSSSNNNGYNGNNGYGSNASNSTIRPSPAADARTLSSTSRPGTGRGGYIPIQVNMPAGLDSYGASGLLSQPTANYNPGGAAALRGAGGGGGVSGNGNYPPSSSSMAGAGGPTPGRVQMKRFEPREAVSKASRTNDLADFLKNSAPPPQSVEPAFPSPGSGGSDEGGFGRVWPRRKKTAFA